MIYYPFWFHLEEMTCLTYLECCDFQIQVLVWNLELGVNVVQPDSTPSFCPPAMLRIILTLLPGPVCS